MTSTMFYGGDLKLILTKKNLYKSALNSFFLLQVHVMLIRNK